jgi:DHA1 family multidrug resistance protein-like MFS transporter
MRARGPVARRGWRDWKRVPGFARVMGVILLITFADRSLGPILPLWIAAQGVTPERLAFASGVLFSAVAGGAVLGNTLCERWLRRRSASHVVAASALTGAVALMALAAAGSKLWLLTTAMLVFGAAIGAATTTAYGEGGKSIPSDAHGEGFGYLNGANLAGLAASPIVAGLLSRGSLAWVFGIDILLLGVAAWVMRPRTG